MTQNQLSVLKWWHSDRIYSAGIALLAQFGKNKILINSLSRKHERFGRGKLEYVLPKSVGLDYKNMPDLPDELIDSDPGKDPLENEDPKSEANPLLPAPITHVPLVSGKPIDEYPSVIRRIKYEYSELYRKRGVFHQSMGKIPEPNTPGNTKERKMQFDQLKEISARMDFLYTFILDYENNTVIPAENIIWPVAQTEPVPEPESVKQLTHKRSLLLNGNYKDNNQLLFQQIKKADKANPMPDGPKKEKIKLRVKKRESEILAIDNKLIEIEKKDADKTE
jgi:hypothetical protein